MEERSTLLLRHEDIVTYTYGHFITFYRQWRYRHGNSHKTVELGDNVATSLSQQSLVAGWLTTAARWRTREWLPAVSPYMSLSPLSYRHHHKHYRLNNRQAVNAHRHIRLVTMTTL